MSNIQNPKRLLTKESLSWIWAKVKSALNGKVDKVNGKGLSTNDYTDSEKTKLSQYASVNNNQNQYMSGDGQWKFLPEASSSQGGIISNSTQTIAGQKTFTSQLKVDKNEAVPKAQLSDVLLVVWKDASGEVQYSTTPISVIGTDSTEGTNCGVVLGSKKGTTIVGAGESLAEFASKNNIYNDEKLYLVSDDAVHVYPGVADDGTVVGMYTMPALSSGVTADLSKGIKDISRNGLTFTATCMDGTTFTFTQEGTSCTVSDKDVTLAWNTRTVIATVAGQDIHLKLPTNPYTLDFKTVAHTYSYSISNSSRLAVSASQFSNNYGNQSGYTAVACRSIWHSSADVVIEKFNCGVSGSNDAVVLKNTSSSTKTGTLTVTILYMKK